MDVLSAKALNYVDINHYKQIPSLDIIEGNAGDWYIQLWNTTENVRYSAPIGASVEVRFLRTNTIQALPANQDVIVPLVVADSSDRSIWKITLSSAQTNTIISGGCKIAITVSGVVKVWPVDNIVNRRRSIPGA